MLDKKYFQKVREKVLSYAGQRREVIKVSGDALHHAKKAIFAMHRDEPKDAKEHLAAAEKLLKDLHLTFKADEDLFDEGAYRAALEEYVEASLFNQFLTSGTVGQIKGLPVDEDTYIGGLCDVPGELSRYAIKSATDKKFKKVKECQEMAQEIIGELVDMDLTGYNRQKFDQAKQALHKLEQVVYEVSLRA